MRLENSKVLYCHRSSVRTLTNQIDEIGIEIRNFIMNNNCYYDVLGTFVKVIEIDYLTEML